MNKLFSILAVLLLASSCITQKRCLDRFPNTVDTIRVVEVKDTIIYRDTIVTVYLPGDIRIDSVEIPCPEPIKNYIPDTARVKTDFAVALAWFKFPRIYIKLTQPDTTLTWRLENAIKEANHWRSEYEKVTVTPQPIKYIPKIYLISFWLLIGMIVAVAGYIGFKIIRKIP
jgi:hypothetical protein